MMRSKTDIPVCHRFHQTECQVKSVNSMRNIFRKFMKYETDRNVCLTLYLFRRNKLKTKFDVRHIFPAL